MKKPLVLVAMGTRPEAIKLAPVIFALRRSRALAVRVCATGQQRELLDQMLAIFKITPDYDLDVMRPNQTPDQVMEKVLGAMRPLLGGLKPAILVVQGDTTTAAAAALAAFYHRVPVAHVEAGLRSFDRENPYPEETNRVLIDHLAGLWLAPTAGAKANLLREGISGRGLFVTGNTAVDALRWALRQTPGFDAPALAAVPPGAKIMLVTLHRRESFGNPLARIFGALKEIARRHPEIAVVYPVHPNPNVRRAATRLLRHPRIHLIPPLAYLEFVELMRRSHFFLTDSGGLQEEAPGLGKPVLIARKTTERPEAIASGAGLLVGTDPRRLVSAAGRLLRDERLYRRMSHCPNPYGDGRAGERSAAALAHWLGRGPRPADWRP